MTDPLVSVLLLTFNRPAALARCLDSLSRQTQQNFELVLVDVSTPPNDALNHALVKAHGDRLVLRHLLRVNQRVAANRNFAAAQATAPMLRHFNPDPNNASFAPGLNLAIPAAGFEVIKGNDGPFGRFGAEDRDFCRRWRAGGGRIVMAPLAVVAHDHSTDLREFLRQYYGYGRGAWIHHKQCRTATDLDPDLDHDPFGSHLVLLLLGWELANTAGVLHGAFFEASPNLWRR